MDPAASHAGPLTPAIQRARRLANVARYLFIGLGLLSIASTVIGIITSGDFTFDLTFIVFFLTARGLRQIRNGARVVGLAVCGFVVVAALSAIQVALITGPEDVDFTAFGRQYGGQSVGRVLAGAAICIVIFGVPFGIFLHPAVRRLYRAANRFRKLGLRTRPWEWCRDLTR
jgi:hypothetical protein